MTIVMAVAVPTMFEVANANIMSTMFAVAMPTMVMMIAARKANGCKRESYHGSDFGEAKLHWGFWRRG
jgi:hypothetical protein